MRSFFIAFPFSLWHMDEFTIVLISSHAFKTMRWSWDDAEWSVFWPGNRPLQERVRTVHETFKVNQERQGPLTILTKPSRLRNIDVLSLNIFHFSVTSTCDGSIGNHFHLNLPYSPFRLKATTEHSRRKLAETLPLNWVQRRELWLLWWSWEISGYWLYHFRSSTTDTWSTDKTNCQSNCAITRF